jgi:hypothetical protein
MRYRQDYLEKIPKFETTSDVAIAEKACEKIKEEFFPGLRVLPIENDLKKDISKYLGFVIMSQFHISVENKKDYSLRKRGEEDLLEPYDYAKKIMDRIHLAEEKKDVGGKPFPTTTKEMTEFLETLNNVIKKSMRELGFEIDFSKLETVRANSTIRKDTIQL